MMKRNHSFLTVYVGLVFGFTLGVSAALVGEDGRVLLDFETGYEDLQEVGTISVSGVDVTIGTLSPSGVAYIAEVGGSTTSFAPSDRPAGGVGGRFSVSDEADRLSDSFDFFVDFSQSVSDVTLDAYDFRADGGGRTGETVSLNAYDSMNQLIGSDVYTITGRESDGNVIAFGVEADGIRRVELVHSGSDVGAGIDNIGFAIAVAAAPEPAEWAMLGLGALTLLAARRRAQQAN